jgi:hypothetical protein
MKDYRVKAPAPPPIVTLEDAQKRIDVLEEALEHASIMIRGYMKDQNYMHGMYDAWPELPVNRWRSEIEGQTLLDFDLG